MVLPTTGQAMEDLMRPDHAEVIDRLNMGGDTLMEQLLETPNRQPYVLLRALHRKEEHIFRFSWMGPPLLISWVMLLRINGARQCMWRR